MMLVRCGISIGIRSGTLRDSLSVMYHKGRDTKRYHANVAAASELHLSCTSHSADGGKTVNIAGRNHSAGHTQVAKALAVLRSQALPYGQILCVRLFS